MEKTLSMQEVLDVLAKRLSIMYVQMDYNPFTRMYTSFWVYKAVPEETREQFKNEMRTYLEEMAKKLKYDEAIRYIYTFGKLRGSSKGDDESMVESMNDEMYEALNKLPKPKEGERYSFPFQTIVCFTRNSEDGYDVTTTSPWILKECGVK